MRQVSDAFLLQIAEVAAGLIGLFLIGVFFFVESGFGHSDHARDVVEPYIRASTRIVLVLLTIPVALSLTLVAMDPVWSRVLFVLLSITLVAANVDTAARIRAVAKATGSRVLLLNEVAGSLAVVGIVAIPWALGGLHPDREELAWPILLSFATGFLSIYTVVMSVFDLARLEPADRTEGEGQ